ncbi:MAG: BamA/TamA family outer membrane protein [Bacteroidales bacterium]|nr:BamA/TamA family outer membrane protein [Bacteroidales bacterium]
MKKTLFLMLALLLAVGGMAQEKKAKKEKTYNEKGEIIKKGWNFGPLPVVGFDADLGFQYGVTCDIFNYGDGSRYPRYDYKFNVEASRYTKGSGVFRFYSDMPYVVKDTKLFFDVTYFYAKKYEFFGFNGYEASSFDPYAGIEGLKSGYHFINRNQFRFVGSMQRPFFDVPNLYWTAGLAYYNTKVTPIDTIKMSDYARQTTLYENYVNTGIIKEDEAHGGNTTQLRLGMVYDSRDHNSDPTKGIYAEATLVGAPDLIDRKGYSNLSYTFLWRQYIPVYKDKLTFAYRLGAQNRLAGKTPWYMINNLNTMFFQKMYTEGLGGSVTMRGVNRNGVLGEGFAFANLELRWRIVGFQFINQNWQVALNPFFDAGMVTQKYRETEIMNADNGGIILHDNTFDSYSGDKESIHMSAGCGLKLIMNRNLIVSVDLGKALDKRDGEKLKTFIGFNYIF